MQTLNLDRINLPKIVSSNVTEYNRSQILNPNFRLGLQKRRPQIKTEIIPSSIQQYHHLLNRKNLGFKKGGGQVQEQRKYLRQSKSFSETRRLRQQRQTNQRLNLLKGITKQIKEIRRQLSQEKQSRVYSLQRNINRIAALRREETNFANQFNSMPMVIPVYLPMPFHGQSMPMRYDMQMPRENRNFDSSKPKIRTINKLRRSKISRKWKKYAYCILFTLFLKKFCRQVRTKRKSEFVKVISSLSKKVGKIKDQLISIIKQVEAGVFGKKNSLVITENDDKRDINQKTAIIKGVINQILTKIKIIFQKNSSNPNLGEVLYHLCNHGNYSSTQPLLTTEQLQMSCISSEFGYISADSNLQIVAITNFIIIKLLLFNNLLAKNRYEQEQGEYKITQNTLIVSYVLYCLALQIEADALKKVPKCYQIGNYQNEPNVRGLQSMSINNSKIESEELISGLRQNKLWEKALNVQSWTKQKKLLIRVLEVIRKIMKKYHSQFIKPFL